jgi:hypothetical protein
MGHRLTLAALALSMSACTSSVADNVDPGGSDPEQPFDPGGEITTYETSVTVQGVTPGYETTACMVRRLDNTEPVLVRRFRGSLTDGSHHMIVYRSQDTVEQPEFAPCGGFSGVFDGDHPIFIVQQKEAKLEFPTDGKPVALRIDAHQMVRIELHYYNPTTTTHDVTGTVYLDTIPGSTDVILSDFGFWGTTFLNGAGDPATEYIPPMSRGDSGQKIHFGISGTKSFAATTHQHQLGTRMRVWHSPTADVAAEPIVDGQNWSDPPLIRFSPPLEFPPGPGEVSPMGLAYRCEWNNTTSAPVYFGESVDDEMCFLWHYYYPSQGFHLCFDFLCNLF